MVGASLTVLLLDHEVDLHHETWASPSGQAVLRIMGKADGDDLGEGGVSTLGKDHTGSRDSGMRGAGWDRLMTCWDHIPDLLKVQSLPQGTTHMQIKRTRLGWTCWGLGDQINFNSNYKNHSCHL